MTADARVPGYLGRVLNDDGSPIGTCFQVSPGVLVTAWHVLDDLGAGEAGEVVTVDALAGGVDRSSVRVERIDPVHDLAVLVGDAPLADVVAGLVVSDGVPVDTDVMVVGVSHVDDPGRVLRWLASTGKWKVGTTRDDVVRLGRMTSSDVVLGMSGGAVSLAADDLVIGVVSGRYNSADGWLVGSVWVARVEELLPLLAGLASPAVYRRPPTPQHLTTPQSTVGRSRHVNARTIAGRLADVKQPDKAADELVKLDPQRAAEVLELLEPSQAVAIIPHVDDHIVRSIRHLDGGRRETLVRAIEADAAIYDCGQRHRRSIGAQLGPLETAAAPEKRHGAESGFRVRYENGAVYWSPTTGAQPVWWAIGAYHTAHGGSTGRLGFPLRPERAITQVIIVQRFQDKQDYNAAVAAKLGLQQVGASVYWSESTGAHSTWGGIGEYYELVDGATTRLRLPLEDEVKVGPSPAGTHGWQQRFQGGLVLWREATGGIAIYTAHRQEPDGAPSIARYFEQTDGVNGLLGFPVGPRHDAATSRRGTKGTLQRFEGPWPYADAITRKWKGEAGGAVVYRRWGGGAEPCCVHGGIGILHETEGGTGGRLGFPLTDEIRPRGNDDTYQVFEGGIVYWTPANDAIAVTYDSHDPEDADLQLRLGFPISRYEAIGGSKTDGIQFFEHGIVTFRDGEETFWTPSVP